MSSRTPFGWFVSLVVTAVVVTVALVAGVFLAALILGFAFLTAFGFWARVSWLRWRQRRTGYSGGTNGGVQDANPKAVIDAEFHVVDDGTDKDTFRR